jgi:potassium-transporting ATPase potassium-binding subunit
MTENAILQLSLFMILLLLLVKPLGLYMANVFEQKACFLEPVFKPIERLFYKCCGIDAGHEMDWKEYLIALLAFNLMSFIFLLLILLTQKWLPLNPAHLPNLSFPLALNTAVSFVTNTNWQAYGSETTMSYFSQMLGLAVHNFISAATGFAVLLVLIRAFIRKETQDLGNFWVDLVRGTLYILVPLAVIWALILMSQGVLQNFSPYIMVHVLDGNATQTLPMGPIASQEAIKELGTNGGGFFNANSAHPFENPTPLSNFFETLALILIPASLCYTFGRMVRDLRQGWALFLAMTIVFVPVVCLIDHVEQVGNPQWQQLSGVDTQLAAGAKSAPGGNMEGKEMRFGIDDSSLYAASTTAASNGSVNSVLDSYTPIGGMITLFLMQLGEVIYGGVGSGLYGMLMMVIITVFIAGLMVGRTPEYLGKKIEAFEMKMAALVVLLMPAIVLIPTAIAAIDKSALLSLANPGAHGFSELLYAFTSMGNNNGSAFAGLNVNTNFFNFLGSLVMALGRFGVIIPVLAIAGSLVNKKSIPVGAGTLPTYSAFFIGMLVFVILIVAGLTFMPALILGPVTEQLQMYNL